MNLSLHTQIWCVSWQNVVPESFMLPKTDPVKHGCHHSVSSTSWQNWGNRVCVCFYCNSRPWLHFFSFSHSTQLQCVSLYQLWLSDASIMDRNREFSSASSAAGESNSKIYEKENNKAKSESAIYCISEHIIATFPVAIHKKAILIM